MWFQWFLSLLLTLSHPLSFSLTHTHTHTATPLVVNQSSRVLHFERRHRLYFAAVAVFVSFVHENIRPSECPQRGLSGGTHTCKLSHKIDTNLRKPIWTSMSCELKNNDAELFKDQTLQSHVHVSCCTLILDRRSQDAQPEEKVKTE